MEISTTAAAWFAPGALIISFLVGWNDMARLKIPNVMVAALLLLFVLIGPFVLPLPEYLWGFAQFGVALVAGMVLNAARAIGAGDAKFVAAAAPYVHPGDIDMVILIFLAALLAAFATHRIAKHTPLRRLVPHWQSWSSGARFPMGLALGATLSMYLILGVLNRMYGT